MDVIGNKLAKVSILLAFGLAIVLFGCIVPFLYMIEIIYWICKFESLVISKDASCISRSSSTLLTEN